MTSERMAILKMLEEGKITAESAAKLLATINDEKGPETGGSYGSTKNAGGAASSDRAYGSQRNPDTDSAESRKKWAADLGKKIEIVAKDLEPKIQKFAGVVVDKSVEIADAATKSIQNSWESRAERRKDTSSHTHSSHTPFNHSEDIPRTASHAPSGAPSAGNEAFELLVDSSLPNEIILKSPAGNVNIKGYNGDKVTLKAFGRRRSKSGNVEFLKLGCVYQLNYEPTDFETLNIEAFIPFSMFRHIYIETNEGDISLDNINAGKITVNSAKCHISIKNVTSQTLKVDNINSQVILSNASGQSLIVENANGSIDAANTDFASLKLETTGEAINIVSQGFYKYNDYKWAIRTSNARIKAILPVSGDTGYELKAYTSLSDVSNGLSGLNYTRNDRNCIEGKSANYSSCAKKVNIELDTSNAPLYIN